MGKSRGGLTTKIHALVDAEGLPIMLKLTEGQAHDGKSAEDMLTDLNDRQILLADRVYDSDTARQKLAARGAWANIKPMPNRKNFQPSARFSTDIAIWLSAFSINSSTFAGCRRGMTNRPTTFSLASNSLHFGFGAAIMSP